MIAGDGRAEFAKVMGLLAALYPRFMLTPETITAYHAVLCDLPLDLVRAAALQCASASRFFPAAAELRAAVFEMVEHANGLPSAPEAWGEIAREVGRVGYYRRPEFSHPLIARAVEATGGWHALCASENGVADRARFLQAYETLVQRARYEDRMLPEIRRLAGGALKELVGRHPLVLGLPTDNDWRAEPPAPAGRDQEDT